MKYKPEIDQWALLPDELVWSELVVKLWEAQVKVARTLAIQSLCLLGLAAAVLVSVWGA